MKSIENPLIPMGAITGKPDRTAITEMLQAYRNVDITQFMIYARSGCELEYMSDEWLNTCEWIIEEAEHLNFTSIWLYDEFNWPSGTCNKQVMKENPDFALQQLCVYPEEDGYSITIRKNPQAADPMNPAAVGCFIRLTHQKYAERFEKYMGNLIKGFFTDEPGIAYFSDETPGDVFKMPYYHGLEQDYREATGKDLHTDIIAGITNSSTFSSATCNRLFAERFKTCYVEKIATWCKSHNIDLTGHLMCEGWLEGALAHSGHPLQVLSSFTLPGIDEIFTFEQCQDIEWITFGSAMYAIDQQHNPGGMAELFALGPCDMNFAKMRKQLYLCAAFGIDRYLLAVSPLDMRANSEKSEYFNPFTPTQPWFEALKEFGEEAKQIACLANKKRSIQISIRYPYTVEPLNELLQNLVIGQYDWELLLPKEETKASVVLTLQAGVIKDEVSGKTFADFTELEKLLLKDTIQLDSIIETPTGRKAEDIFIRRLLTGLFWW
jgi:hypothetical protein